MKFVPALRRGAAALLCSGCTELDPGYEPPSNAVGSSGAQGRDDNPSSPGASTTSGNGSGPSTTHGGTDESIGSTSGADDGSSATATGNPVETTGPSGCAADPNCHWWDAAWSRRVRLDVDPGSSKTPLFEFPLLVTLDEQRVDFADFQADGQDVRMVTDFGEVLEHEVDSWTVAGESHIWVKIPDFSGGPLTLWLYYGNPGAPAPSSEQAWSSNYRAVWHMGEELDGSTTMAHSLASTGTGVVAGVIGQGRQLGGNGDCLDAGNAESLKVAGEVTITMWIRMTTINDAWMGNPILASGVDEAALVDGGMLAEWFGFNGNGAMVASWSKEVGQTQLVPSAEPAPIDVGQWHHLAFVRHGGFVRFFVDGEQVGGDMAFNQAPAAIPAAKTVIGADPRFPTAVSIDATVDEVRIYGRAMPPSWVGTEVRSARDELITYGAVEEYW